MESNSVEINSICELLAKNLNISPKCNAELLPRIIDLSTIECHRCVIREQHWGILLKLLSHCQTIIQNESISVEDWDFLANIYRCLRNCSAGCYEDGSFFMTVDFFDTVFESLLPQIFRQRLHEKEVIALRCGLQMLGNIANQSIMAKEVIWKTFYEKGIFILLLRDTDKKIVEITMMILFSCVVSGTHLLHHKKILSTADGMKLFTCFTEALSNDIVDWGVMLLESVIANEDFIVSYDILSIQSRFMCLDVLCEELDNKRTVKDLSYLNTLKGLRERFVNSIMDIVNICDSSFADLKSVELTKFLSVLCSASAADQTRSDVQDFSDVLEVSIDVLKSVHFLGKKSTNAFSSVPTLRDLDCMSEDEIYSHPSFCFKKDLIRLIGNMCYKHKTNQDLVRKLDGIPLLMDCCNLDARNPYIMQWCIFAIRNILESNSENQATMASISLTAEMGDSPLLKELGLTVKLENGRPVLVNATMDDS